MIRLKQLSTLKLELMPSNPYWSNPSTDLVTGFFPYLPGERGTGLFARLNTSSWRNPNMMLMVWYTDPTQE